jgi:hypothetical protein
MAGNRLPLKAQLEAASASNRASHARIRVEGASIRPFDPDLLPPTHAGWAVPVRRLTPLNKAREPGDRATPRDVAHNEAPEGTGGRTGQSVRTGSEQVRSRYAPPRDPRSVALRPSNPAPGTVPRIAPRCGLAVRTCPFGQDEMYRPRPSGHNRLIHELRGNRSRLIPDFPPDVDGMWTSRVATSAQRRGDVDSRDGGG